MVDMGDNDMHGVRAGKKNEVTNIASLNSS